MASNLKHNVYDLVVIGAGIVGLATAFRFLESKPDSKILIIEKEDSVAKHQSGNNSGVIHSGIYYKPGSSKAINCIKGYNYLLEFAAKHNISHEICGKIIVAVEEKEIPLLDNIYKRGLENGLEGLQILDAKGIKEIEPNCSGVKGIFVPQAGIINYHGFCIKLKELIEGGNGSIKFNAEVTRIDDNGSNEISIATKDVVYKAKKVVSCAGLFSDRVTRLTNKENDLRIIPFRGEYYKLKPESEGLVKHLIYPVPDPNFPFLGVHFTRMIKGGIEAGPNAVLAFKREGYKFFDINLKDFFSTLVWPGFWKIAYKYGKTGTKEMYRSLSKKEFTRALQKLIPVIQSSDLVPGGAGVRAQACTREGKLLDDFDIVIDKHIIHVRNAPSPAATSALAIGEHIVNKLI